MEGKILHMGKRTHSTLQNSLSFSKTSLSYAISPALLFHLSLSPSSSLASELFSLLLLFSHNLFSANQPDNKQGTPAFTPYISPPMPPSCLQSYAWSGSLPTRPGSSSHYFPSLTTLHPHWPSSGLCTCSSLCIKCSIPDQCMGGSLSFLRTQVTPQRLCWNIL